MESLNVILKVGGRDELAKLVEDLSRVWWEGVVAHCEQVAVVEVECSGTGRGIRKVGDGRAGDDAVIRLGRRRVRVVSC